MPTLKAADAAKILSSEQIRYLQGKPEPVKPKAKKQKEPKAPPAPLGPQAVAIPHGRIGSEKEQADRLWAASDSALGRVLVHNRAQRGTCGVSCPYGRREQFAKDAPSKLSDREGGRSGLPGQVLDSVVMAEVLERHKPERAVQEPPTFHDRMRWWSSSLWAKDRLGKMLQLATRIPAPLRIHDRGDFGGFNGKPIDVSYVRSVRSALATMRSESIRAWTYTHTYHRDVASLRDEGLNVYATIHSESDRKQAERAGFGLFALVIPMTRPGKVRAILKSLPVYEGGDTVRHGGREYFLCPQTTTPNAAPKCSECLHCPEGRGHTAFLLH